MAVPGPRERASTAWCRIVTGRRTKFLIFVLWAVVLAVSAKGCVNFQTAQKSATSDYLPASAESKKAGEEAVRFPSGRLSPAAVVYRRAGGLTTADKTRISSERKQLVSISGVGSVEPTTYSTDHTSALVIARVPGRPPGLITSVKDIRNVAEHNTAGLDVAVTGPAALTADSSNVFKSIDTKLFAATFGLVLVLLILIYRSPVFWILPLIAIVFAVIVARGIGYLFAKHGVVTVTGQAGGIMSVLVFGVGTDYSLLLVARYREALRHHDDSHLAAATALQEAARAIIPSSLTVMAGLLCLELARVKGTSGLGAIGAAGVAVAMISMMTLLPALLATFGQRMLFAFKRSPQPSGSEEAGGVWHRIAERVSAGPRRVWVASLIVLAVMAVGLVDLNSSLTTAHNFRNQVDSVKGQRLVSEAFPPGVSSPAYVVVTDLARANAVRAAVAGDRAHVASVGTAETEGGSALFEVDLAHDPTGASGFSDIKSIRNVARSAAPGQVLVGGDTAEEVDLRALQSRDNVLIIPVVLVLVLLILTVLLRAAIAPLLLIGTVVASFAATLGLASVVFGHVFTFQGLDPSMPLFTFVLLVSLGVDYNIFLMTRVRDETQERGTREGMTRGLTATGGVITSAGIVLAGTFCTLALLPLVALTEVGLTIAFGALLDTFLVRSLLVPALVLDVGPRTWWPSALARAR